MFSVRSFVRRASGWAVYIMLSEPPLSTSVLILGDASVISYSTFSLTLNTSFSLCAAPSSSLATPSCLWEEPTDVDPNLLTWITSPLLSSVYLSDDLFIRCYNSDVCSCSWIPPPPQAGLSGCIWPCRGKDVPFIFCSLVHSFWTFVVVPRGFGYGS